MAVPSIDSEKQLAWEARHRKRAGIAAIVGAVGLFLYFVLGQLIARDAPAASSGLEALVRAAKPGNVGDLPSLATPYYEYLDSKSSLFLTMAVAAFLGFTGLAWAAGFLAVATRGRMPGFRRYQIYLPIVGGVVLGLSLLLLYVSQTIQVAQFLDSKRTVSDAVAVETGVFAFAKLLGFFGALLLAIGLILVSMNAMRVGLLTKFYGFVGIVAGAMLVICPLAIVHTVWLLGLGLLFLGRWPGGDLPAWKTGNAEPWPAPERPQRGRGRVITEPSSAPATTPSAGPRRKRKKRH